MLLFPECRLEMRIVGVEFWWDIMKMKFRRGIQQLGQKGLSDNIVRSICSRMILSTERVHATFADRTVWWTARERLKDRT